MFTLLPYKQCTSTPGAVKSNWYFSLSFLNSQALGTSMSLKTKIFIKIFADKMPQKYNNYLNKLPYIKYSCKLFNV